MGPSKMMPSGSGGTGGGEGPVRVGGAGGTWGSGPFGIFCIGPLKKADLISSIMSPNAWGVRPNYGAYLSEAKLIQDELESATGDENTRLPPDLKPPAHWGVKPDEQAKED
jgi:hypothetical protein